MENCLIMLMHICSSKATDRYTKLFCLIITVLITVMHSNDSQDAKCVSAILRDVLQDLKKSGINGVYLRSDNAGLS